MARIRRALISVYDKRGVVELARELAALGWELVSTGGTAMALQEAGLPVVGVEEYTGFPEMLDGRVKTLHPRVHGGILFRRDLPAHEASLEAHGIVPIDMVVVNLYPFEATAARPGITEAEVIEQIDIGGPSMVRSAAKNHRDVYVVVNPDRYEEVVAHLRGDGGDGLELRRRLAREAFARTSAYDAAIAQYLTPPAEGLFPEQRVGVHVKVTDLRYGENPHQAAAVYREPRPVGANVAAARLVHGAKQLSYNNYLDADAALQVVLDFEPPTACVVKHCNPCGASTADDLGTAFEQARDGDPESAFGGIVGLNGPVTLDVAQRIARKTSFFEVIVAPSFTPEAVEHIATSVKWGKNVRLLEVGELVRPGRGAVTMRTISGGLLAQEADQAIHAGELRCVTRREPTQEEARDLEFAWRVVKHVRSNAIVFVRNATLVGVGAGQMSRVGSVRIAAAAARERAQGAVMGSDAFFPFPDGVETAAAAGVTAVVQPGGSRRDKEVIEAADGLEMAMLLTGMRHFRH
jgi:phosphoribosylaminoimidazolecarboxamide formyltransferase/IMP cyclohydrolase